MGWIEEIVELHDFFERWFTGSESTLDRMDAVLAPDFSIMAAGGAEATRAELIQSIQTAKGARPGIGIATSDHRLLYQDARVVVARYVEVQTGPEGWTRRLSTVVFVRSLTTRNGVEWLRVHETWLDRDPRSGIGNPC